MLFIHGVMYFSFIAFIIIIIIFIKLFVQWTSLLADCPQRNYGYFVLFTIISSVLSTRPTTW